MKRNLIDEIKDPDSHSGEKFDITDDVLDTGTDTSSNHSNHGNFLDIIDQGLAARVALPTFKMYFEPGTFDYFSRKVGVSSNTSTKSAGKQRQGRWESLLAKSVAGLKVLKRHNPDTMLGKTRSWLLSWLTAQLQTLVKMRKM